ncbi:MAG: BON domain-containing protein [Glaciecola sp.]|jgi:osmotically-inducible protein OsmY
MKHFALLCILVVTLFSQGCTVVALGSAVAVGASSSADPRSIGTQLDDTNNALSIGNHINKIAGIQAASNIDIEVFNRQLLLTGQVVDASWVKAIDEVVAKNTYIEKAHNQIRVAPLAGAKQQAKDIIIANTIRAKLFADERVSTTNMNVIVNNSEVFLMGLVTNQEATIAVDIARNVNNVTRVNRVFEIISPQ